MKKRQITNIHSEKGDDTIDFNNTKMVLRGHFENFGVTTQFTKN